MKPSKTSAALVASLCAALCAGLAPAARAATETVVYSFQNNRTDGYFPAATLTVVDGVLYGTTESGGTGGCYNGCGTVFSVDPATGAETVLSSFGGKNQVVPGSLLAMGGKLFGTTADAGHRGDGSLFSLDLQSGKYDRQYSFCSLYACADGSSPNPGLIDWKGVIYGTTYSGGQGPYEGTGVAFSFDPKTAAETTAYLFCSRRTCADGEYPTGGLQRIKAQLYGVTTYGGKGAFHCDNCGGAAFRLNPATGRESVLYSFCSQTNCTDGDEPQDALIEYNGLLYGVTAYGGGGTCNEFSPGCGTVFSIDPKSGTETVLYDFQPTGGDGVTPTTSLVELNGVLYGVTGGGGTKGVGVVYSVDPSTGAETVVYSFCSQNNCADGEYPDGGLVVVNGTLYGTTRLGGAGACGSSGCGTVYAITP
jgi:uncharacterized repeat protein (TIGR03803 family)